MNSTRYFMRREDYREPTTPAESPFRKFNVTCLKCRSYQLRVIISYDEDSGETRVTITCTNCKQAEEIKLTQES